jgi:fructoselysine-6-P-deglycase FrlB-like protein
VGTIAHEIDSQPACWRTAALLAQDLDPLFAPGERAAVVGCGTSYNMALAVAALREGRGFGETDAFPASEMPQGRSYDKVLAISRSGTTTEVIRLLHRVRGEIPTVAVSAVADTPLNEAADRVVVLDFADEQAVVQTRFATTALALMRAQFGDNVDHIADEAQQLLRQAPVEAASFEHFVFLGRGWSVGLAHEAALKVREAASAWAESYPAMEYRHGPISVPSERSLVWMLDRVEPELLHAIEDTHATVVVAEGDPMAEVVRVHRAAVGLATSRGLDPDNPRRLTRSVVLTSS